MKKLTCLLFFGGLIALASCDKIKDPIQNSGTVESKRKVLLEDYTGHTCGNCPPAAEVAEKIYENQNGKVVTIAVHAGFFSKVKGSNYPTSYTTTAGNDWDKFFIGNSGNPNGMVNRKNYQDNGLVHNHSKWASTVALGLADIHYVDLEIKTNFNSLTRKLNTTVSAIFEKRYANNTLLSVVLIEDSVIGPQTDYRLSGNDRIPNYVFMHMLRDAINGTWGTSLKKAPIAYRDSVTLSFTDFAVRSNYKEKNLSVVAFVYDEKSYEVLQVEKVKLK
jgi:thiol-disulfide isomerase/thioredoxin